MGKTRKKSCKKKKKECYWMLETLVDELGCKLLSLADEEACIVMWEFEVERVEFLKKLVRAEFASNPEKTKHLRHISNRLHALEEALHLVLDMLRHHTHTPSSFSLPFGGINQADTLSLCSCSNYGDDDDDVVDAINNEDQDDDDDDDDSVLCVGPGQENKEKEVSCATTLDEATAPLQCMVSNKVNFNDQKSRVVEMKEEEARKRSGRVAVGRSSCNKVVMSIKYWWLLLVMMVMCFSGFFLFTTYQDETTVILTPT